MTKPLVKTTEATYMEESFSGLLIEDSKSRKGYSDDESYIHTRWSIIVYIHDSTLFVRMTKRGPKMLYVIIIIKRVMLSKFRGILTCIYSR